MLRSLIAILFIVAMIGGTAWASEKDLALEATTSIEQAIKTATDAVPGAKPYEAEITKRKGQVVYKIALVDAKEKAHKVYVDAQSGKIVAGYTGLTKHVDMKDLQNCDCDGGLHCWTGYCEQSPRSEGSVPTP